MLSKGREYVKEAKKVTKKITGYDVIIVKNKDKLIYPVKEGVSAIQAYKESELFYIKVIGHGGLDIM